jgi:hypothetical protein
MMLRGAIHARFCERCLRVILVVDVAFVQFCLRLSPWCSFVCVYGRTLPSCSFVCDYGRMSLSCGFCLRLSLSWDYVWFCQRFHEPLVCLSFIEGLLLGPLHFRGASFFIGGLLLSPLHFRGASFFMRGLLLSPLRFRGASFFIGGLLLSPLRLGVPLFSRRSF